MYYYTPEDVSGPKPPADAGDQTAPMSVTESMLPTDAQCQIMMLTDAPVVAIDWAGGPNYHLLLTAAVGSSRVIGFPTNVVAGQRRRLRVIQQGGVGLLAITWAAGYRQGLNPFIPAMPATAGAVAFIELVARSSTIVEARLEAAFAS